MDVPQLALFFFLSSLTFLGGLAFLVCEELRPYLRATIAAETSSPSSTTSENRGEDLTEEYGPLTEQEHHRAILSKLYYRFTPVYNNLNRCIRKHRTLLANRKILPHEHLKKLKRQRRRVEWRLRGLEKALIESEGRKLWEGECPAEVLAEVDEVRILCGYMRLVTEEAGVLVEDWEDNRPEKALADACKLFSLNIA